jgi:hypothetical protein
MGICNPPLVLLRREALPRASLPASVGEGELGVVRGENLVLIDERAPLPDRLRVLARGARRTPERDRLHGPRSPRAHRGAPGRSGKIRFSDRTSRNSSSEKGGRPGRPRGARGLPRPDPRRGARGAVGGDFALIALVDLFPGARLHPGLFPVSRRGSFVTNCGHTPIVGPKEVSRGRHFRGRGSGLLVLMSFDGRAASPLSQVRRAGRRRWAVQFGW